MSDAVVVSLSSFIAVTCWVRLLWPVIARRCSPIRRRLLSLVALSARADRRLEGSKPLHRAIYRLRMGFDKVIQLLSLQRHMVTSLKPSPLQQVSLMGLLTVVASASYIFVYRSFIESLPALLILPLGVGAAWIGMCLTVRWWLHWYAMRRAQEISDGFINVLDMWILCLGAGMSFQSALVRVSQDSDLTTPTLYEELRLTNEEIRAGCPRDEALRHLVRRCGDSSELRGLVSHIIQSERMGTSLGQALKAYADSLRFKRRQDASEMNQKLPAKLAFPLVFFIFPALLVVILGPSAVRLFALLARP